MNDFAKSQLMKYGWKEGKGLGKHENGITEALKPKLKFNTIGIGHKNEDNNNWWENAFNKAASSITVQSQTHGVSIFVSKENTTDNFLKEDINKKEFKYENFLKTSTLFNGNLIIENNSNIYEKQNIEENINQASLTDEELFKICNGRTAHKGARHGLTLNGKLKRIAQQDKYLLNSNSCMNITTKLQSSNNIFQNNEYEKINDENIILPITSETILVPKKCKTTERKNRRRINDLSHQLNILCNVSDSDEKNIHAIIKDESKEKIEKKEKSRKRKRKKEKKILMSYDVKDNESEEIDNCQKYSSIFVEQSSRDGISKRNVQKQINNHKKKKKKDKKLKKKNQDIQCKNIINTWEDDELNGSQAKKFKRSHKIDSDLQLIKNEDIKSLECKFQTELSCNEVPLKHQTNSSMNIDSFSDFSDTYFRKKVKHLNIRIAKKKQAKLRRKVKIKLDKLTESLRAVHFNTEESTEKNIKNKNQIIPDKIMDNNIIIDRTEPLKRKKKKKEK